MLCVALGPLVSAALLSSADAAPSMSCIEHAGHGMPCDEGEADAPASASAGHCPLCIVLQHPALLGEAPPGAATLAAQPARTAGAVAQAAPHDRTRRWVQQRMHAPPPRG